MFHWYTQYCYLDECPPKLRVLLEKYGCAFDDYWYYKICGRTRKVVTRRPLWLDRGEGGWMYEKHPKPRDKTVKLTDFIKKKE